MSLARNLFSSSLGKKYLMALTGFVLIGFVTGHLVGNLQIFSAPEKINGYAAFLQGLGPALWAVRLFLLLCVGIHIWAAVQLTLGNNEARPVNYDVRRTIRTTLSSKLMRWSGFTVFAFILFHLAHFTLGAVKEEAFNNAYVMQTGYHLLGIPVIDAGAKVHDVHTMMVLGFQSPLISILYVIAIALLTNHLWHGFSSAFQSLGLRTTRWAKGLQVVTRAFCILYLLGNIAIPAAILAGVVKEHGRAIHEHHASASAAATASTQR